MILLCIDLFQIHTSVSDQLLWMGPVRGTSNEKQEGNEYLRAVTPNIRVLDPQRDAKYVETCSLCTKGVQSLNDLQCLAECVAVASDRLALWAQERNTTISLH